MIGILIIGIISIQEELFILEFFQGFVIVCIVMNWEILHVLFVDIRIICFVECSENLPNHQVDDVSQTADVRIPRNKLDVIFLDEEIGQSTNENVVCLCIVDSDKIASGTSTLM